MTDPIVPNLTPDERHQVLTEGRRRVRRRQRAGIAAGALVLLAVLLPVAFMLGSSRDNSKQVLVGGHGTSTSPAPSTSTSTTSGVTSPTSSPSTTTNAVPSPTLPPTTTAPKVPTVKTIVPDQATKDALRQAFLDYKNMKSDEIGPDAQGTVYVAHVADINTWWATAFYTPTAAMTFQHAVNMQDDGGQGIFTRWDDGQWHMVAAGGAPLHGLGRHPQRRPHGLEHVCFEPIDL